MADNIQLAEGVNMQIWDSPSMDVGRARAI